MSIKRTNRSYAPSDDITHFMLTAASAGGIVTFAQTASFTSNPDDPDNVVAYAADPSGKTPAGVLMMDVISYDPTVTPRNEQNPFEVCVGSKVWVVKDGYLDTNMVSADDTIVPGVAYLGNSGLFTNNPASGTVVGRFESYKDSDGYVKVSINL